MGRDGAYPLCFFFAGGKVIITNAFVKKKDKLIQNLRSGEQSDMKLSNLVKLSHASGYDVVLEKAGARITL